MMAQGTAANLARDPYRLDFVLMPMVKMLAEQELSWSQRQQIAQAMLATMRHHKSMVEESQPNSGVAAGAASQNGAALKQHRGQE